MPNNQKNPVIINQKSVDTKKTPTLDSVSVKKNKIEKNINNTYSGLTIDLPTAKVIREIPATTISINKIEIEYVVDIPVDKKVIAYTKNQPFQIILWEGEAYDTIGQWTDEDVKARILELYK